MSVEFDEIHRRFSPWVIKCLKKKGIEEVTVEVTGMTEKGDNYMGDVLFVIAKGKDNRGQEVTLHLVIKKGKENQTMEANWDSRSFYLRENILYERIFPAFEKFQIEKGVDIFDSVPKCYGVLTEENCQAILMENLRESGYELHDRFVNMNSEHIKFVLYNYAKFHAISFAMRDQDRERFEELTNDMGYLFKTMLLEDNMRKWYESNTKRTVELLEEADPALAKKFGKKIEKGLVNMLVELGNAQVEECVITHGDCWNNNFMFKYENPSVKSSPTKVSILDWQLSMLHSPVVDLSYFLHIVSSTEEATKFGEYLRYYHENLSDFIGYLGSDPTKLYPYPTLLEHWERYSYFGISVLTTSLELMTCDKDDAIDMGEFKGPEDALEAWKRVRPKNLELYKERILANIRQYCEGL